MKGKRYIYVQSKNDLNSYTEYIHENFDNIISINKVIKNDDLNYISKKIKEEKIDQVIFQDYFIGLDKIISHLCSQKIKVKLVWTKYLSELVDDYLLLGLIECLKLLKEEKITTIGFVDKNFYELYKSRGYNVNLLKYNVKSNNLSHNEKTNNITIGIYGNEYDWQCNMFNQFSSVKLIDNYQLNLLGAKGEAKRFLDLFNIKYRNVPDKFNRENFRKNIIDNDINLFVEFCNYSDLYIIDSFNHGIPCILGNNNLFFKDTELEKYIIVKSDDDVNEIAEKINLCYKNKDKVIKIYKRIKKEYDKESKENLEKFIEM